MGFKGLNYTSGKTFTANVDLPVGYYSIGAQVKVRNPRTGVWTWDKYVTFGYGQRSYQGHCKVKY